MLGQLTRVVETRVAQMARVQSSFAVFGGAVLQEGHEQFAREIASRAAQSLVEFVLVLQPVALQAGEVRAGEVATVARVRFLARVHPGVQGQRVRAAEAHPADLARVRLFASVSDHMRFKIVFDVARERAEFAGIRPQLQVNQHVPLEHARLVARVLARLAAEDAAGAGRAGGGHLGMRRGAVRVQHPEVLAGEGAEAADEGLGLLVQHGVAAEGLHRGALEAAPPADQVLTVRQFVPCQDRVTIGGERTLGTAQFANGHVTL